MDRYFSRMFNSLLARALFLLIIVLPIGSTGAWVGAAYLSVFKQMDFMPTMLRLISFGYLGVLVSALPLVVVVEKWIIKDRALRSPRWVAVRIVLYLIGSIAVGAVIHLFMRFGMGEYPLLIEAAYYVMPMGGCFIAAAMLSLMEQAFETLRRREAGLIDQNIRLTDEVQGQRQYAEALVQNSPVAIVSIDAGGGVASWNPAAEKLFGYTAEQAIGRSLDELVTQPDLPDLRQEALEITQHMLRGESLHAIVRRCKRDGQLIDLELMSVPVKVQDGNVTGLAIYHDITEMKRAESALQQAKEAAEAATHAKSVFLATMSHEIRTPMNGIIGMTSLLQDTHLTPEQREFTETIASSGETLLAIINDILDFSKIEAGRIELEHEPFDLRRCVESALELVVTQAASKGLELGCLIEEGVPAAITGDATRLRQVLTNLLSNAIKFTEEGEVTVAATATCLTGTPGDPHALYEIHFAVHDTGIGIPADRMDRLFRSFSQVDNSTSRKYGGTGLGLAISKRLCELMEGKIWVESEGIPGKGSTFHFTIQAEAADLPPEPYLLGTQPNLSGKRVLIVDDNETSRRILSLQTQNWGMLPHTLASPQEALALLQDGESFDLGILDMHMPEIDGFTLAGEIRKLPVAASMHLVIVSSVGQGEVSADKSQVDDFLLKPIRPSQLYNSLVKIFAAESHPLPADGAKQSQFDPHMAERLPLRILAAEDNAVNQNLIRLMLSRLGYSAQVVANGLEVLQALRQRLYDVVLMDVQMPEMDGLEATRVICREWPTHRRPRIIAMTANVTKEDRQACLEAGMDDYVSKPVAVAELVRSLSLCSPIQDMQPATGPEGGEQDVAQPRAEPDETPLDAASLDKLRELSGGDTGLLVQLIQIYLEDAPKLLADMGQAVESGDAELLRRAAHSLKSNSAEFGASELSALARSIEEMGKAGALEGASEWVSKAQQAYAQVEAALLAVQRDL